MAIDYKYFPTLRTKPGEMMAVSNLSAFANKHTLPALALGSVTKGPRADQKSGRGAKRLVLECMNGRPFVVDLSKDTYGLDDRDILLNHTNGFKEWRDFVQDIPNVIPTIQWATDTPRREISRQVQGLVANHKYVALRLKIGSNNSRAHDALFASDEGNNFLIYIEAGDLRDEARRLAVHHEIQKEINEIRELAPNSKIVLSGSSFPRVVSQYGDSTGRIEILEINLHDIFAAQNVEYGDYAAVVYEFNDEGAYRGVPIIPLPLEREWYYERRRQQNGGYDECARAISMSPDWDPTFAASCWGAGKIQEAIAGTLDGIDYAVLWTGVRANIHMERQALRLASGRSGLIE